MLLDAVPCSWSACYANSTAMNAGIALNSDSKLLVYQGGYWKQQSNASQMVLKKLDGYYHSSVSVVVYAIGKAGNGLFYDGCEAGLKNLNDSISYCSSKGMRSPSTVDAIGWSINGVPSCTQGITWTTSTFVDGSGNYGSYVWFNTNIGTNYYLNNSYVRCVY